MIEASIPRRVADKVLHCPPRCAAVEADTPRVLHRSGTRARTDTSPLMPRAADVLAETKRRGTKSRIETPAAPPLYYQYGMGTHRSILNLRIFEYAQYRQDAPL